MGMLAYKGVRPMEIRRNMNVVKHKNNETTIGDHHKVFAGDNALLAGGNENTMSQFG